MLPRIIISGLWLSLTLTSFGQSDEELGLTPEGGWGFYRASRNASLPMVLLIGDSVQNGYGPLVQTALSGEANVDRWATPDHLATAGLRDKLAYVLSQGPYDVVHFNLGLHGWPDGRIPDGQYGPLMELFVGVMQEGTPASEAIWASTTSISITNTLPQTLDPIYNPVITQRNAIAYGVMTTNGIPVNDLYSLMIANINTKTDRFHYNATGYNLLKTQIIPFINQAMANSVVVNRGVLSPLANSATLFGSLLSTGDDTTATVFACWGSDDGGMSMDSWSNTTAIGTQSKGSFQLNISGLSASEPIYYRTYSTNSVGEDWAPESVLFTPGTIKSLQAEIKGVDYDSYEDWLGTSILPPHGTWDYGSGENGAFTRLTNAVGADIAQRGGDGTTFKYPTGYPQVGQLWMHPYKTAPYWARKRWTSPITGEIEIEYEVMRTRSTGNGTQFSIYKNGVEFLVRAPIEKWPKVGIHKISISAGDTLDFNIDANGTDSSSDGCHFWCKIRTGKNRRPNTLPSGLLFHWTLNAPDDVQTYDENRYTKVADWSGNNNYATGGSTWELDERSAGKMGNCLNFNGEYISSAATAIGNGATQLTISVWVNLTSLGANDGIVTMRGAQFWGIVGNNDGTKLQMRVNGVGADATQNLPIGEWTHLALVWQRDSVQRLYMNGEIVIDVATPYSGTMSVNDSWRIGVDDYDTIGRTFQGAIDDIALWKNTLTQEQVQEIYNLGQSGWDASYLNNSPFPKGMLMIIK